MHWFIIIAVIFAIIYGIYLLKEEASDITKAIIFLLVSAIVFAIIGTFAFETICAFLWKASLIIAGILFLYGIYKSLFNKK